MSYAVILALALCGVPQGSGAGRPKGDDVIDAFLRGEAAKIPEAVQILAQNPTSSRDAIDARLKETKDEPAANRLRALRTRVLEQGLLRVLVERMQTGLTFSGQWADLGEYDPDVASLLLGIVKQAGVPGQIREGALNAIADLHAKSLIPELKKITDDILNEDLLIEGAGLAMAELGDRSWIDRRIAALNELAANPGTDVPRAYAAAKQLARYHYRLGDHKKAIECYTRTTSILEGRLKTIDERHVDFLRETLRLTYYNTACSACKAGLIDNAFTYLEKAVAAQPTAPSARELDRSIQEDGDLRALRADPRYQQLREKLAVLSRAKSAGS
jgi:tetratricopeptide (TPR) repeat protein